ncbi:hypothetical protein FKP32DRAFT_1682013 [Trametes sanguinea]|nr:hypothetical protein FKP32DRAFT_1682013 [Trametes sanguinea]
MSIMFMPLPYMPIWPNRLRSLTLFSCTSPLEYIVDFLSHAPRLRSLDIIGLVQDFAVSVDDFKWAPGSVRLPSLRWLSGFHPWPAAFIHAFLSMLVLPKKTKVLIYAGLGERGRAPFNTLLPADFPPLQDLRRLELIGLPESRLALHVYQTVKACEYPSVKVLAETSGVFREAEGVSCEWSFPTDQVQEVVLCDVLPAEQVRRRSKRQLVMGDDDWRAFLRRLPALKGVRLMSLSENTLASFGRVLQADPTLCPKLVRVEVFDNCQGEGNGLWASLKESLSARSPEAGTGGRLMTVKFVDVLEKNWTAKQLRARASKFAEVERTSI